MLSIPDTIHVALIGIGATALMDLWLLLQQRLGIASSSFALIGRWVGHIARGRFMHASIEKAAPIRGENGLGWLTRYAVGIAYAALQVAIAGPGWLREPTWAPALAVGIVTVLVPLFVMQPAMGAGLAGAKTAMPWRHRLRSLGNHAIFGFGLYLAALALQPVPR